MIRPIDSLIVELYLNILHLNDISFILDGYIKNDSEVPLEVHLALQRSASTYISSEGKLLRQLQSKTTIDRWLSWFHKYRGWA